jgi:N-acetylglucosamine-1-phosphodiester alpha-N-acetylglucosaminidase
LVKVPVHNETTLLSTNVTILDNYDFYLKRNRNNKGYLVSTNEKFTVQNNHHHNNTTTAQQQQQQQDLTVTSKQAQQHGCHVATNGGPFHKDGTSVGGVVIDFNIASTDFSQHDVGFGIIVVANNNDNNTDNRHHSSFWILGGITNASEAKELGVQYYLTGFDWLVYEGQSTVSTSCTNHSNEEEGEDRAPRTAIGVDKHGRLLLLVVDGCEDCFHDNNKGLTLDELANLLTSHGAEYAINLDGGGSSTLVQDGQVVNVPTCMDISIPCQRPVATIVCVVHEVTETQTSEIS